MDRSLRASESVKTRERIIQRCLTAKKKRHQYELFKRRCIERMITYLFGHLLEPFL